MTGAFEPKFHSVGCSRLHDEKDLHQAQRHRHHRRRLDLRSSPASAGLYRGKLFLELVRATRQY